MNVSITQIEDGVVNFDVMVELAPDRYKQQVRDGVAFCKDRSKPYTLYFTIIQFQFEKAL